MTKDTNFKFGKHAPIESSQGKSRYDPFEKAAWPGSRDPINFWALNASSSKVSKGTNFEFGMRATREIPAMTPENFFEKGAWLASHDPVNYAT